MKMIPDRLARGVGWQVAETDAHTFKEGAWRDRPC